MFKKNKKYFNYKKKITKLKTAIYQIKKGLKNYYKKKNAQ